MPEGKPVDVKAAKGRPMLTWVGKKPLRHVTAFPAQKVEVFDPSGDAAKRGGGAWADWPAAYPKGGLLFHGDNKEVLAHLLANGFRGKVKLIYIDPPFNSGADYVRKVQLRGATGTAKLDGETYTLGEQVQYDDIWANDNYLQFMYERLLLLRELLAEDGNILVQADDTRGHYIKILLDEVLGPDGYVNDIVWHKGREGGGGTDVNPPLPTEYQNIYLFAMSRRGRKWNAPRGPYKLSTLASLKVDDRGWYYERGRMGRKPSAWEVAAGVSKKTYVSDDPAEDRASVIARLTDPKGEHVLIGDVWNSDLVRSSAVTGYPTEKPENLLRLIINAGTDPDDLVLDCFAGSGTTMAVAQKLGRRWIGCDINKGAIQTSGKRLQDIVNDQIKEAKKSARAKAQGKLIEDDAKEPEPAQLSFSVYRVNDYDLQIQHNEAVNLACEHIGIKRTQTDSYFDGVQERKLAKIIPFSHPLTVLDLEELKKELGSRPDEDRDVLVVSLGKELSVEKWLEDWNRLRKTESVPNKIEVIELRTDPKYGRFMKHEPASARVDVKRKKDIIAVEIRDFISPTIIERLRQQAGLLEPRIDDWRAMVDTVMIDTAYDGEVFNVCLSDVPEKKADLVKGKYELPAPEGKTTVAVKITDMLGEETLETKTV